MGVSTDAILVFGIDLNDVGYCEEDETPAFLCVDEDDEDGEGELEFHHVLMNDAGLALWDYHDDETKCEPYEDYKARRDQAQEQAGVDLVRHCHYDYAMHILAVAETELRARRGHPLTVDPDALQLNQLEGKEKLRAFCDRHGIPWQEPRWILCSDWG